VTESKSSTLASKTIAKSNPLTGRKVSKLIVTVTVSPSIPVASLRMKIPSAL
jgi:hypothetical protein